MREVVLFVVVVILCCLGLLRPLFAILAYFWFGLMHPDIMAYASHGFPYSLVLACVAILSSLRLWTRAGVLLSSPFVRWFAVMQGAIFLSVFLAVDSSLSVGPYAEYLRIIAMPLLIPIVVQSVEDLRTTLIVVALSLGLLAAKFGMWGLLAGGSVFSNGYGGMMSDNNDMALAFSMAVILCWYCRSLMTAAWMRLLLLGVVFAGTAAVIMTHSRGGALSLGLAFLLVVYRSRHRIGMLVLVLLIVAPSVYLVRESYLNRLASIETYQEDGSAVGRIENAKAAFAMWQDYPFFGVGFGMANYVELSEQYGGKPGLVVHNTYMQTLADDGICTFIPYVGLLFGSIVWLGLSVRRMRRVSPESAVYPVAIQTALVVFAIGSTFLSRLHFDLTYILIMCAATWYPLEKSIIAAASEEQERVAGDLELSTIPN